MKMFILAIILWSWVIWNSTRDAAAQSQLVYSNMNWQVLHATNVGFSDKCYMISKGSVAGTGLIYLVVYSGSILMVATQDTGFTSIGTINLRVGDVITEVPTGIFSGIMIVNDILTNKGKEIVLGVNFDENDTTIHIFPVSGFHHAYRRMQECVGSKVTMVTIE